MNVSGLFVCLILTAQIAAAGTAREAWESLLGKKASGMPEFVFVENDPALPNVLIYGDSISIHYTERVRTKTAGKANVYRLYRNGGDSNGVIEKLSLMHDTMRKSELEGHWDFEWDLIQLNVGLHDLKYLKDGKLDLENGEQVSSLESYEENLRKIISYLKVLAPEAQLVLATTTPVPVGGKGRIAGDSAKYNTVALEVMKDHPEIVVNDLYNFTLPDHSAWWSEPGNVHFNQIGRAAQGDEVARVIVELLD